MRYVLAFFHYALFLAVPVFFVLLFDGRLWPRAVPTVTFDDPLAIPVLVTIVTLMTSLFVFAVRLGIDASYREACFKRLAGLKERDEREAMIVGDAARQTFLLSLAAIAGLFVISIFRISFNAAGLQLLGFDRERTDLVRLIMDSAGNIAFDLMPLTETGLLGFLLLLQLAAFRFFSRRAARQAKQ